MWTVSVENDSYKPGNGSFWRSIRPFFSKAMERPSWHLTQNLVRFRSLWAGIMRLLCSTGQRDSAVSYTIASNKNYTHWYRIIVYSYLTCGFDRPHAIKRDVSHVTKYPRLSPFFSIFVRAWESLGTRLVVGTSLWFWCDLYCLSFTSTALVFASLQNIASYSVLCLWSRCYNYCCRLEHIIYMPCIITLA